MFDWNNGTDFIVRIFVRSNVYKLTEKKDNVKIECFFLNLLEGSTWFSVTKPSHCTPPGSLCFLLFPFHDRAPGHVCKCELREGLRCENRP